MALRTSLALMRGIMPIPPSEILLPLIQQMTMANQLVNTKCLPSQITNPLIYTNDLLTQIETLLACHFYDMTRRRTQSGAISGGASETKEPTPLDMYLSSSLYGQNAMAIDTDGNLAAYNNTLGVVKEILPVAGPRIVWLGTLRERLPRP